MMENVTTRDIIAGTLIGIGVLILAGAILFSIFGLGFLTAQDNNEKVRQLTEYCVSQGFDGFTDDYQDDKVGCYKN